MTEMMLQASAEALKALDLLPSEPAAHALLGIIEAMYNYDWKKAEDRFRIARASEFLSPVVHSGYAHFYLLPLGRFEEAIHEGAKAIAQDPLNARWHTTQAFVLLCAERYDLATLAARKALEIDNGDGTPHLVIAQSYFFQGEQAEALQSAEEAFRIAPWNPLVVGLLAGFLERAGEKERARKLIETLHGTMPTGMVMYHLVCAEIDAAIGWYEHDIELRHLAAAPLASAGFLKPLRAHPRWPKLAKMMNLPGN
jgi:tetratricopeptide (TPR) repeat protein